jgi:hypothetical protein
MDARAMTQAELEEKCKDRWWRLCNLYWIVDKNGKKCLFTPNRVQRLLLNNFWFRNLVLKSRQHGVTTFLCILFLDMCLFNDNVSCGIIAHRLPDAKNFFNNKIKFAYQNLPELFKLGRPLAKSNDMVLEFDNGSSIAVSVSLRSGTVQYLHISEFGKVCAQFPKKAAEIVSGALNTVVVGQYIFIESTAEGASGYFFDYCDQALKDQASGERLDQLSFKIHFFSWWQDPANKLHEEDAQHVQLSQEMQEYFEDLRSKYGIVLSMAQKGWYQATRRVQGELIYREHPSIPEEAFFAIVRGAYYAHQMFQLRELRRIVEVPWDPRLPVETGWDLGMADTTCIVFRQRLGSGENRIIDYYENNGEGLAHYVKLLQGKPYTYGRHYLPHDSAVRSMNDAVSREDKLYELGLRNLFTVERTHDIEDGIEETRNYLMTCWIDKERAKRLVQALDEYRKKWNEEMQAFSSQPLHNWASNPADAFRTLACGVASNERSMSDMFFRRDHEQNNWRTI